MGSKLFYISILCVFLSGRIEAQSKNLVLIGNDSFYVYETIYSLNSRVDPPGSLADGNWVAYYSDSTIAFKGFFLNGNPQNEFYIYEENRIAELFYFKDGQIVSANKYWWLPNSKLNGDYQWGIHKILTIDSLQKSLSAEYFNNKGEVISKSIYQYSENAFGAPFIRNYEETEEFLQSTYYFTYNRFGKQKSVEKVFPK